MKVVEIFDSIDGEGLRTGHTATFIRLAGCNLRCTYCDTLYALFGEAQPCLYTEMDIDTIISNVNPAYKRITLTGGEPLIHNNADALVNRLCDSNYQVNIETNGAADTEKFLSKINQPENMFFTIDYKLPSSGMTKHMLWNNFKTLRPCDVIKFVIGSDEDVITMCDIIKKLNNIHEHMPYIYAGVVFGMYEPSKLVDLICKNPLLKDVIFQLQIHKFIWHPEQRGV